MFHLSMLLVYMLLRLLLVLFLLLLLMRGNGWLHRLWPGRARSGAHA